MTSLIIHTGWIMKRGQYSGDSIPIHTLLMSKLWQFTVPDMNCRGGGLEEDEEIWYGDIEDVDDVASKYIF